MASNWNKNYYSPKALESVAQRVAKIDQFAIGDKVMIAGGLRGKIAKIDTENGILYIDLPSGTRAKYAPTHVEIDRSPD